MQVLIDNIVMDAAAVDDLRVRRGMSRKDLREKLKFSPATMARIFNGTRVSWRTARAVAAVLGVRFERVARVEVAPTEKQAEAPIAQVG